MGCETSSLPPEISNKLDDLGDELQKINKAFEAMHDNAASSLREKEQRVQRQREINDWKDKCEEKLLDLEECVGELDSKIRAKQDHDDENAGATLNDELEALESVVAKKHRKLLKYITRLKET